MPLLVALSAFQARTQDAAFEAVTRHAIDGVQLTPGNLPSPGFERRISAYPGVRLEHHGFAWEQYRRPVYDAALAPIAIDRRRSVHPPRTASGVVSRSRRRRPASGPVTTLAAWLEVALEHDLLLETMYPGYVLGTGEELEAALAARIRLCVDVSHLSIQRASGCLSDATLRRVLDYERVEEVHVSRAIGRRDAHAPHQPDSFGLDWARARASDLPVVLESYWHRVPFDEQQRQLDLLREPVPSVAG